MASRIAVIHGSPEEAARLYPAVGDAELLLSWDGPRANVCAETAAALAGGERRPAGAAEDLLEIATAVYVADIAVKRGVREEWPRAIDLAVPVREVELWRGLAGQLRRLIYEVSRDTFELTFLPKQPPAGAASAAGAPRAGFAPDCVSMLSGGLDSLAGAVMLQQAGRRPAYSLHRSGNPAVRAAQEQALAAIEAHWPGHSTACPCIVEPCARSEDALFFPPPEEREPSRRCRSLLFMALALATAEAARVGEVFMCENGVLTAGLPLSASRAGSMSTHSTHPAALGLMNRIAEAAGMRGRLVNPFVYQTKAELIRDILAPNLSVSEIQSTVSCWAAGRANRQCGGCVPCLLRQLGMAWAELPEEAWMVEVLARPDEYTGTDAWGNLVDILRHAERMSRQTEAEMLVAQPGLLSLLAAGLDVGEVIAMLKRHAEQALTVVKTRYPEAARLIE